KNHVFLAVDDADPALPAHDSDVTRLEITILCERSLGFLRHPPISLHHLRPAYGYLASLTIRQLAIITIKHDNFGRWQGNSDISRVLGGIGWVDNGHRRCF